MRTLICEKCNRETHRPYMWWDESGYGYSTKLWKCRICNGIQIAYIKQDKGLDVNADERFYEYNKFYGEQ